MTFLDLPEPDDNEQPDETENVNETDGESTDSQGNEEAGEAPGADETNGGDSSESDEAEEAPEEEAAEPEAEESEELPEFDGIDKEIDDLRKDLRSEPGATTLFRGSVTIKLNEVFEGNPGAQNELFALVMEQLEVTARKALSTFKRLQLEPLELINIIFPQLSARISEEKIQDRQHFYALASLHCRRAIHRELRNHRLPTQSLEGAALEEASQQDDPSLRHDLQLERDDLYFYITKVMDDLTEESRKLVDMVFFLGSPFREIATFLETPRSTVHDRYLNALEELRGLLRNLPDDIED